MDIKVIFDTNTIRNQGENSFFGEEGILLKYAKEAEVIIPSVVIEEIKRQKKQFIRSQRSKLINNNFCKLIDIKNEYINAFDIENHIKELYETSLNKIGFTTLDLRDEKRDTLEKMTQLALQKEPPFEPKNDTDKGFKDALIYFSILEYLQKTKSKNIFVCTKDKLLSKALEKSPVTIIEDFRDFQEKTVDTYSIDKIDKKLESTITKDNIIEFWTNIYENKTVLVKEKEIEYVFEMEYNDVKDFCSKEEFQPSIEALVYANDIETIRDAIDNLKSYSQYISDDDILLILGAAYENENLRLSLNEFDIQKFIYSLYKNKKELLIRDNKKAADFLQKTFNE